MTTVAGAPQLEAQNVPERAALARMYELMLTTNLADDKAREEAKAGRLQAAFYPVRGLEGVCAALSSALRPDDQLVSTYRNLGDALAKGVSLRAIVAELYGRVDGTSHGKGGGMHLHDRAVGFMTTTGIVGSGLPIAAGLALGAQLDGDDRVVVVTFGDGATSIGAFHEAMNIAALWSLPVVFLCQNNQWGEHTPIAEYAANVDLTARAASYGMAATRVDGFDVMATLRTLRRAVAAARSGAGPVFVEAVTYRLTGHTGTADFSYVPADELDAAMKRDPAPNFRTWLHDDHGFTDEELSTIEHEAQEAVSDAFDFAQASPFPAPEALYADVFAPNRT
ncbi:Acetoin:2,6-dichlorophenolindophenol oxidoreductase subunit alpha [Mycolicibacterium vanbaalenii]|uniref:Acetoin:2,6-dichlorophenolindophenol oxidoreductase subunit alpha n=1 Tax=Mycolicibacterium vanbaalenii TaxID=110539 RepID=A0A5S9PPJ0_MYCVN|nr:thiamine pyrophosphate-dependent dehydrogenase E1 component subunit alpha [Mycolicibacterium vanbaalenii]CAA0105867.1 Acetoin:2,6-dichlorophenolindophenol oxidoreductase subunit alpha [Mycolicibacterium vanbaalenii]